MSRSHDQRSLSHSRLCSGQHATCSRQHAAAASVLSCTAFQVGYKGYCGTLGADYISYMLTDAVVSPPDYAVHFAEKLMYMPLSHYINNYR